MHWLARQLVIAWAKQCRPKRDPDRVIAQMEGRAPVTEEFALLLQREIGCPVEEWPWVERVEIAPVDGSGKHGSGSVYSAQMEPSLTEKKQGRGRPSKHGHPIYDDVRKAGYTSLEHWCEKTSRTFSTWASRVLGRYRTPGDEARAVERELGTPVASWDAAYDRYHSAKKAKRGQ